MPLVFSGDPGKDDPAPFTFSASHTPTKKIGTVVVDVYHQKSSGKDGKATASATLCAIGTNQAPVLTLLGSSLISLTVGASYADAGATATDTEDGDLTSSIVVTGAAVDTSVPGTSTVRYNVKDSFDVPATELTRTIVVSASASSSGQGTSTDQGEGDTEGGDNDNEGDEENDENNGTTTNTTTEVATSSKTVGGGGKLLNAAKKKYPGGIYCACRYRCIDHS